MPGPQVFLGPALDAEEIDYAAAGAGRPEPERRFYEENNARMFQERIDYNAAGRELELGPMPDLTGPDHRPPDFDGIGADRP